jgi:hypothetical protein
LSHGTCSYIRMYINTVADSVMVCLRHDFCNMMFQNQTQIIDSLRVTPLPKENFWVRTWSLVPHMKQLPPTISYFQAGHIAKTRRQIGISAPQYISFILQPKARTILSKTGLHNRSAVLDTRRNSTAVWCQEQLILSPHSTCLYDSMQLIYSLLWESGRDHGQRVLQLLQTA